jgi:tRNA (guanine10-N2)-methyltransferase
LKVKVENDKGVQKLLDRAILIKDFMEMWAEGSSFEALHASVKAQMDRFEPYRASTSFKFLVKSYGKSFSKEEQVDIINSFGYTDLKGPIRMKDPEIIYGVFVDTLNDRYYFGIYVGRSLRGRHLDVMDLKKREYLGTTSMDAELSLVMTNMGLVTGGSLVYDPFVGTGSFMYTAAYFGGFAMGSDIDGRQMRGKAASSTPNRGPKYQKCVVVPANENASMYSNIEQYGLGGRIIGGLVFDIAHNPWSDRLTLSAIVTDPPYGVRAGAKKLGARSPEDSKPIPIEFRPITYPATQPYALEEMNQDLLDFAARSLLPGGRLVFWYPVEVEEQESFDLENITAHSVMKRVAASVDRCKGFHRWLITMEKPLL